VGFGAVESALPQVVPALDLCRTLPRTTIRHPVGQICPALTPPITLLAVPKRQEKLPQISLVLVELGGDWPTWLNEQLRGTARRVLCQNEGERPGEFVDRVLEVLARERLQLRHATLLCNERADFEQATAREKLSQALDESFASHRPNQLAFANPERARQSRPALAS